MPSIGFDSVNALMRARIRSSVEFCHRIGLDYVSCSPYRVPLARLAAAQAALKEAHRAAYVQAGG